LEYSSSRAQFVKDHLPKWLTLPNLAAGVIFFLLGLLVLGWSQGYLISAIDWHLAPSRIRTFYRYLFLWDINRQFGGINAQFIALLPYTAYLAFTEWIGWSPLTAQNLLFHFWLVIPGLSMYGLYRLLAPASKNTLSGWIAAILTGCFYVVNPFTTYIMWTSITYGGHVTYAFLPLIFALFVKGLQERKGWRTGFGLASIAAILLAPGGTTPKFLIIAWGILLGYAIYAWLSATQDKWHIITFTGFVLLIWILLSAWYLVPQVLNVGEVAESSSNYYSDINRTDSSTFAQASMDLIDAFRQVETPLVNRQIGHEPSTSFILASFMPALLVFGALCIPRQRKIILFFLLMTVVGLFLLNRTRYPSESVAEWILERLHLLHFFRGPKLPFGILAIFAYTIPFGVTVEAFLNFLKDRFKNDFLLYGTSIGTGLLVFISTIMVFNWPLWTGDLFESDQPQIPSPRYEIPNYYREAADWLQKIPGEFRSFAFPLSGIGYMPYAWEHGYWGPDIIGQVLPQRVIFIHSQVVSGALAPAWYQNTLWKTDGFSKLLALTNTRFVVIRQDVNITYFRESNIARGTLTDMPSPEEVKQLSGFHFVQSFGQLDFYENENWRPMQVYSAVRPVPVKDMTDQLALLSDNSFYVSPELVFVPQTWPVSSNEPEAELTPPATFSAQMINPTLYQVHVETNSAFYLVLSEMFHPGWKVYVGNKLSWIDAWRLSPLDEKLHFVANGFANGWYIPHKGAYDMLLYFHPQNHVYLGALVSVLTVVVGGFLALLLKEHPRRVE